MQLKSIHHVAVICSDYEISKHFYTQILGLEVLNETCREDRQSYKLDLKVSDNNQIELFSFPNLPTRLSYPEACGLRHLAFEVDDVDVFSQYLKDLGIQVEAIRLDEVTGKRFSFFQNPDGLPIELYES